MPSSKLYYSDPKPSNAFPSENINEVIEETGETPLTHSIKEDDEDRVKLLLANGADVNAKNRQGNTALISAIDFSRYNLAKILLSDKNIKVNSQNLFGYTALDFAFGNKERNDSWPMFGDREELKKYLEEVIKLIVDKNGVMGSYLDLKNLLATSALTAGIIGASNYVRQVLPNFVENNWNKASSVLSPITNMIEHATNSITSLLNLSIQNQSAASSFVRRAVGSAMPVIIAVAVARAVSTFMGDKNKHNTMTNSIADALYEGGTALAEGAAAGVTGAVLTGVATSLAAGVVVTTALPVVGAFTAALAVGTAAKTAKNHLEYALSRCCCG